MTSHQVEVNFASSNPYKIVEVSDILNNFNIKVIPIDSKVREIQANCLEEIAADSARTTAQSLKKSVLVEDAGLFICGLKGFPGPYSSYAYDKIGCKGILKLMQGIVDRAAVFVSAVSYCEPTCEPKVLTGEVKGKISLTERGGREFGYDPIFIPDEVDGRAFSELSVKEKNSISHRFRAFQKFAVWFITMQVKP